MREMSAGRKRIEYREIRPYWSRRLAGLETPLLLRLINGMQVKASHAPKELVLRSSGKRVAPRAVRPYAICETPPFVGLLVANPTSFRSTSRLSLLVRQLFVLTVVTALGCGSPKSQLIGKWTIEGSTNAEWEFFADDTCLIYTGYIRKCKYIVQNDGRVKVEVEESDRFGERLPPVTILAKLDGRTITEEQRADSKYSPIVLRKK